MSDHVEYSNMDHLTTTLWRTETTKTYHTTPYCHNLDHSTDVTPVDVWVLDIPSIRLCGDCQPDRKLTRISADSRAAKNIGPHYALVTNSVIKHRFI